MALSSEEPREELFPNQPLAEVVCEVRFYGEPVVEAKRHEFFEAIREDYPLVYVPPHTPGVHTALQHYRFEKEDRSSGVSLAINSFGYFQREYQGAKTYKAEMTKLFSLANSYFSIQKFSRIGWRYINVIPFVRTNQIIPLDMFFKDPPRFFDLEAHAYEWIDFKATTRFEDVLVSVKLEADSSTDGDLLFFDIDVFKNDLKDSGFKAEMIPEHIDKLHRVARNFFDCSITEAYYNYLKGKDDE